MRSFIAKRLASFDSSKIRAAFELAENIPNPIDLSIGYPEDNSPDYIKLAAVEAIQKNHTRYTPANGMVELRTAIAAKLSRENAVPANTQTVSVTPGVTTGILLSYLAVLDPGDEVLLPDPFFPPYKDIALMLGAKIVAIDTAPAFQLSAEQIEPLITGRTKVLVLNTPNNPSGAVYPKHELLKIAESAGKHGLLIISDEIYEHFSYDMEHFSIGSVYGDTLTLNGFSKGYSMTGWRIGYINGPQAIVDAINELQQYTVFSSSSISQHAALSALRRSTDPITAKYRAKRDAARRILQPTFPDIQGAHGAFYFFLKLPAGVDDMSFISRLGQSGVIALPGSAFSNRNDYFRISFAAERDNLEEGLRRVCQTVSAMTKESGL